MLVLSRKCNQQIIIGEHIELTVLSIKGSRVQLGITAPEQIQIQRGELRPPITPELTAIVNALVPNAADVKGATA